MARRARMSDTGTMEREAQEYLALRRKLGVDLKTSGRHLLAFGHWFDGLGHRGPLTTALAIEWARLPQKASPHHWARRLSAVRPFARYRIAFDPATEIPPRGVLGSSYPRTDPHIYSQEEIAVLLGAASGLEPVNGLMPQTYVTLLGLLVSSGLRVREALRLTSAEVDLETGVLTVSGTKFHKSRLVPVHPSTREALARYVAHRDRRLGLRRPSDPFFVADPPARLTYRRVRQTFVILRRQLGWDQRLSGRLPRIYDLRHTFACRRLLTWYREGVDVHPKLASLSTYLGHTRLTDTYWYLTAVPDLMALAAERFERQAGVFDER